MSAKDLMIDFVNYLFFIVVSLIFIFYFVLGDRLDELIDIIKSMMPLAVFGLALLFKLKAFAKTLQRTEEVESINEDEVWCFTDSDRMKDYLITFFLPVIILAVAFIDGEVNKIDIYQSLFSFFYILFFHSIMLRKGKNSELRTLTMKDKNIDEIIVFLLPVIMLLIPMSKNTFDTADILQTVSVFTILFIWHQLLYKKES